MTYSEPELILPALKVISEHPFGVKTSILIKKLVQNLQPSGHDAEIISGRNDTYFTQKVRNLKSHDTLTSKGLATYEAGLWKLTEKGARYIMENEPLLEALQEQGFARRDIDSEIERDFSGIIIEEGALKQVTTNQRQRSDKLRNLKIAEVKQQNNEKLSCEVCGFDFQEKYGELGKDFIHIHHTEMIHEMDINGSRMQIEEALKKVVPLCSNCHSMVHRNRKQLLPIDKLKEIVRENSD